ncbi:pentapeptide repeat-containing protein [Dictyobacter arantiisoli]|uniref:Pentapeptide repeat-containing protein n=1 Tax=Dictyobacter arantiisoli TaxID=2014874 RepID=A0A5A5TDW4_9CHLR|nr:pentapeptide repeat-containing protein [Dictyobacter arantiisoli]GCF09415.1 hypothetical protein KDI_29790 [Dictyobacter arantiisoli]
MLELLLIGGVIGSCIIVLCCALIAVQIQKRGLERLQHQQAAWECAQDTHKKQWEERQDKLLSQLENELNAHLEQLQKETEQRLMLEADRVKYELSHVPRVEDTPLPARTQDTKGIMTPHTTVPLLSRSLRGANLSGYDLSYRYLHGADLRNVDLANSNLFMADLSGACLRGASLIGADLSAANCVNTDFTGADLTGANLLVTDLNDAVLVGATLQEVHNLSNEQIHIAIVDSTTRLDSDIDITLPRIPRISLA